MSSAGKTYKTPGWKVNLLTGLQEWKGLVPHEETESSWGFLCVTIVGKNDGDECVQSRESDKEQKSVENKSACSCLNCN